MYNKMYMYFKMLDIPVIISVRESRDSALTMYLLIRPRVILGSIHRTLRIGLDVPGRTLRTTLCGASGTEMVMSCVSRSCSIYRCLINEDRKSVV